MIISTSLLRSGAYFEHFLNYIGLLRALFDPKVGLMNEFETNYQMLYFPPYSQTCHSRALTIYWVGGRLMRITNAFEKHKDIIICGCGR